MANEYVSATTLKATLGITVSTFDTDITTACSAASRGIDRACNRRFWVDADANQIRYYTPNPQRAVLFTDDIVTVTTLAIDQSGGTSFATTLTANTDYVLEPLNAAVETPVQPYTSIRLHPSGGKSWPAYPRSVKITGKFGWPAVPDEIVRATTILATKLFKRQESPFGIVTAGVDQATAMRIAMSDPDVKFLISPFIKLAV